MGGTYLSLNVGISLQTLLKGFETFMYAENLANTDKVTCGVGHWVLLSKSET